MKKNNTQFLQWAGPVCLLFIMILLTGCHDSDNGASPTPVPTPAGSAQIAPSVNPVFDSVEEVATSESAAGPYSENPDATYDTMTNTVSLADGVVPAGGLYVRVTGPATITGETSSYTVYTFVVSNTAEISANELTSIAVGLVAEGLADNFIEAIAIVAEALIGLEAPSITAFALASEPDPALTTAMMALSNQFKNSGFIPGTTNAEETSALIGQCIDLGGRAWDNMNKINAGGTGMLPAAEPEKDYQRCKACHGWDQLGTDGGYARRSRKESRPNAGNGDPNTVSRNISSGPITLDMVLHAGTGRSWAEGSAVFDSTDPWGPGAQKGNEHPDLSQSGINGSEAPSAEQALCLTVFLNYPEARANQVFAMVNPNSAAGDPVPEWCTSSQCVEYTLVSTADAERGEAWYNAADGGNCLTCHGQPEDEVGPIAPGPAGGLLAFLRQDGKYSEFRHKVQWGEAGSELMTRENMNNPTAAQVADVLAYLQGKIEAPADLTGIELGARAWDNMSNMNAGGTGMLPLAEPEKDYQRCKACHGWDQLGTDGGYARRSRKNTRPNAGFGDPDMNMVSRNVSNDPVFGAIGAVSEAMVLHAGTGRSWSEGSAIFDSTDPWGTGAQKGNEHPDLSLGGANGSDVPSAEQIAGLTQFLNYPDARMNVVFAAINPDPDTVPDWCTSSQCTDYTVVSTADAARGEAWYNDSAGGNCVSCHGAPEDAEGPIADGPAGGLLVFLRQDGKYSEFRHKVQWGESGNDVMTRANMNDPTGAQVADVLAFLAARIQSQVNGVPFANDDSATASQDTALDIDVLANDSDPNNGTLTVVAYDSTGDNGGTVACTGAGICTYTPPASFTGIDTFTYTVSNGENQATATVTVTVSGPQGDPAAGQARFQAECGTCHSAGSFDMTIALGGNELGGRGAELVASGKLINNLVETDQGMEGIELSNQEILDMAAFLDSL
jgi:mono/diheme cytochrome c family protein